MSELGLHMPVVGAGPGDQGDATLVRGGGVGAENIVAKVVPGVDTRGSVGARWEPGLGGYAEVDVLDLEVAQQGGHFAVAAVLHVVGG